METVKKGILRQIEYVEPDKNFYLEDVFNVLMGLIEGSMGAVESNLFSFQCSRNSSAVRADIALMSTKRAANEQADAISYFVKVLQRVDDLTINCVQAVDSEITADDAFSTEEIGTNVLYNAGFMFTDILDIIYYDYTDTNPYWYYVSYRMGDFFIRFFIRDEDL